MKCCAVCVVRDAEDRIAEWIAYHLAIGFDAIILIDNGSQDGTLGVIKSFQDLYDVRTWDWPMGGLSWQALAYEHAVWKVRREFDWALCIDDDEFLILPEHRSIHKFAATIKPRVASFAFPWAMYGSSGRIETPLGLVIENYLYRASGAFGPNRHVKCMVRPDVVIDCLSPHHFEVRGECSDHQGTIIPPTCILEHLVVDLTGVRINHYFVRSRACWTKKMKRGYRDFARSDDDFVLYDQNEVFDDAALRNVDATRRILQSVMQQAA